MSDRAGTLISQGAPTSLAVVVPIVIIVALVLAWVFAPTLVAGVSRGEFALVTAFLGGGAAWLSGRSMAHTWRSYRQAVLYALLLACVVRFFHYALFQGTLLSLHYFIVDAAFVISVTTLGFRAERANQMATRYGWIYRRSGPFGWTEDASRASAGNSA